MKIYSYLSYRREMNETDVYYTCNLQKVWDSSDSLNGNSCSLFIFIWSTIPMISGDFLTLWNAITVRKGREKDNFRYFIFLDRSFRSLTLWRKHLHSQPSPGLYVNFIAVRKYNFLDYFLFCFVCKLFTVTIRNISLQFLYNLLQVYIVRRVSFIFHLNVFLVSVCTRGFGYLLCWPRGRGKGLVCTRRFSFHEFYNFLLFNF